MLETSQKQEKLFGTENDRFISELERNSKQIEKLIESSKIDALMKKDCKKIINSLKEGFKERSLDESDVDEIGPYVLVKMAVTDLSTVLGEKNEEQYKLYKILRDAIYGMLDSVLNNRI